MREKPLKLLGLLIIIASFGFGWLLLDFNQFRQSPLNVAGEELVLHVEPGSSVKKIAAQLHQSGVMEHPRYFAWMARWQGKSRSIQAGEYALTAGITPQQLLDRLVSGQVIHYGVTVVEGWTFRQFLDALHAHDMLEHTLLGLSDEAVMTAIGLDGIHPEGRFLPETYHFVRGTKDADLLRRAYSTMEQVLEEAWENRAGNLPLKSPYEALILASIVEKETGVEAERPRIAGVFVRRLQKGMRLQTDPTVIYGLGADYDGNIRRRDLTAANPYNTYVHRGLPPTPIALPGREAIHAALHPADGDSLYFVSRGDGSHYFSATLEEHNRAVRRYQLKRR